MSTETLIRDRTEGAAPRPLWKLWDEYRGGSIAARDTLVLHYAPLVKFVAGRLAAGLPASVDQGDLVSAGVFGLMDALERFDPERGIRFETYAVPRIRGAILDELRALDWVPRAVRADARGVATAREALAHRLGREPDDGQIADHLGISRQDLARSLSVISRSYVLSLEAPAPDDGPTISDTLADEDGDPASAFDDPALLLPAAIAALPERERQIVTLYYDEGMTLAEVGEILGVSESRICQILGRAVGRLRASMQAELDAVAR